MPINLVKARVGQVSYLPGDEFTLNLQFDTASPELSAVNNLSVDLFRAERQRNQFARGFGAPPSVRGAEMVISHTLPADFSPGLYVVGAAVAMAPDRPDVQLRFGPLFFAVLPPGSPALDERGLRQMIDQASHERQAHAQKEIPTPASAASPNPKAFRVLVLGVGSLLHAPQPLEGFTIYPLRRGFSYGRMLEIANQALRNTGIKQISFDPQTEQQTEQATPTFAIEYWRVLAADHVDALEHCRNHASLIFDLLGLHRGQKPREFFCAAREYEGPQYWFRFFVPGYAGNLVSDFNPVSTANLIETVTPKLDRNPFLRLLVRSYADATAESDIGIALLRAWTVLELLADRAITKGRPILQLDGTPILNARGNPKDTNAKEARVYELIRLSGSGFPMHSVAMIAGLEQRFLVGADQTHAGYTPGTRIVPLWDMVRAAYAIRNRVAHEGFFSEDAIDPSDPDEVLAADLIKNTPLDPRRWVKDQAESAVSRELNKP
jgi:hypothetical protein